MKIVVLIKQVPDTETRLNIDSTSGNSIDETGIKWITSPFDENGIEEAIRQRDKTGAEVHAVSLGPERVKDALRSAYVLGVDIATLIKDDSYNALDINYASAVLASYIKTLNADIIFTGHTAIDSQSSMVPAMIACHLGIPNVNNAIEVHIDGNKAKIHREIEGGKAVMELELPTLISAAKDLNDVRYPSLKGIMAAKKKEIEIIEVASLGVELKPIEIVSIDLPPARPSGRIIEGDSAEVKATDLVKSLREEVKVF